MFNTYGLILCFCRFAMLDFPMEIQAVIEIVDPSISHYLIAEPDLLYLERWVTHMNMDKVELIFIPYNQRYEILNSSKPSTLLYINV